jgi:hypothetical protein
VIAETKDLGTRFAKIVVTDERGRYVIDDVENLSQIWAVAPALVKLALRDDRRSQKDKEPPWKKIAEGPNSAT